MDLAVPFVVPVGIRAIDVVCVMHLPLTRPALCFSHCPRVTRTEQASRGGVCAPGVGFEFRAPVVNFIVRQLTQTSAPKPLLLRGPS